MATIGELTNVPEPGAPLQSQWAQDVTNRIVHRYASKAALDVWAAPVGTLAQTMDDGMLWRRAAGGWSHRLPRAFATTGLDSTAAPVAWNGMAARITVAADPSPRFALVLWHVYSVVTVGHTPTDFVIKMNGVGFVSHRPINDAVGAAIAADIGHNAVIINANADAVIEAWAPNGWRTFGDPNFNLLTVVVHPGTVVNQVTPVPP